jgi:hypothetical protein
MFILRRWQTPPSWARVWALRGSDWGSITEKLIDRIRSRLGVTNQIARKPVKEIRRDHLNQSTIQLSHHMTWQQL